MKKYRHKKNYRFRLKEFILYFIAFACFWGISMYGDSPHKYYGPFYISNISIGVMKIWDNAITRSDRVYDLFLLTNKERQKENIPQLIYDVRLGKLAQIQAEFLYNGGEFSHVGFEHRSYIAEEEFGYNITAENIAGAGWTGTASDYLASWMDSPGHRANILDPLLTHIGIGICGCYAVQFFAGY